MPRLALLALALCALFACTKTTPPPPGNIASKLTIPTGAGPAFDPATLGGKPAVIVFWRPGCPHCVAELPDVAKACKDKGATAIAIQVAEAPPSGLQALEKMQWDGVTLVDDGTLRKELAITKVPWTLVLRPDGTAARAYVGRQSYDTLAGAISAAAR